MQVYSVSSARYAPKLPAKSINKNNVVMIISARLVKQATYHRPPYSILKFLTTCHTARTVICFQNTRTRNGRVNCDGVLR